MPRSSRRRPPAEGRHPILAPPVILEPVRGLAQFVHQLLVRHGHDGRRLDLAPIGRLCRDRRDVHDRQAAPVERRPGAVERVYRLDDDSRAIAGNQPDRGQPVVGLVPYPMQLALAVRRALLAASFGRLRVGADRFAERLEVGAGPAHAHPEAERRARARIVAWIIAHEIAARARLFRCLASERWACLG
jgi:hypothetical protein